MIEIDGSEGEGGGQVVRNACALSLVTGTPFRISNVRGGREKPGMMRQHVTAVGAACRIGGAACEGPRRVFPEAALKLYGVYELQTLEDVIRSGDPAAQGAVAATIRRRAGLADDADNGTFLLDYYLALCVRLEGELLVGRRRLDKFGTIET